MDEAAAAATTEDGAEKRPHNGDTASENYVGSSSEDSADSKYLVAVIQTLTELSIHHEYV